MSSRFWISVGAVLAAAAVAAGAVGTHMLSEVLKFPASELQTYEVAVRYQMYHALGLILIGVLAARGPCRFLTLSGWAFLAGIALFSGGLYAWLFTEIKPFVHVVPAGGLAWIFGWLCLAMSARRSSSSIAPSAG